MKRKLQTIPNLHEVKISEMSIWKHPVVCYSMSTESLSFTVMYCDSLCVCVCVFVCNDYSNDNFEVIFEVV